jgi:hypothetical protein
MSAALTVGELRALLEDVPDYVWVCLRDGPLSRCTKEMGAGEPFVLFEAGQGCSIHGRLNDFDCSICKEVDQEVRS